MEEAAQLSLADDGRVLDAHITDVRWRADATFLEYRIELSHLLATERIRWAVWRRFSAFSSAREAIRRQSNHAVPALPPKLPFSFHSTSHEIAMQRIPALQAWLRDVLASPEALASPATLELIGFAEAMEAAAKAKEQAAQRTVVPLEEQSPAAPAAPQGPVGSVRCFVA